MTVFDRAECAGSALKEAIQNLQSVFESLALAALILNRNADVVFANDFLLSMIGRGRSEVLGENWIDLVIPDEGKAGYRRAFENYMTGAELHNPHEREIFTQQGERRYIRWNVTYPSRASDYHGGAELVCQRRRHQKLPIWFFLFYPFISTDYTFRHVD
jgi:PAS domain S-box-containing protein